MRRRVAGGYESGTVSSGLTWITAVIGPRVHAKLPAVGTQAPFTNAQPGQPVALPLRLRKPRATAPCP